MPITFGSSHPWGLEGGGGVWVGLGLGGGPTACGCKIAKPRPFSEFMLAILLLLDTKILPVTFGPTTHPWGVAGGAGGGAGGVGPQPVVAKMPNQEHSQNSYSRTYYFGTKKSCQSLFVANHSPGGRTKTCPGHTMVLLVKNHTSNV